MLHLFWPPLFFHVSFPCLQNIIKKVNGQKFVYRFVSYPDILKGEPARSEDTPTAKRPDGSLQEAELADRSRVAAAAAAALGASSKQSNRNDYIHSGLYTSFHLNSLQNRPQLFKSIKMENPAEKMEKRLLAVTSQGQESQPLQQQSPPLSSVIKFGNSPPKPAPLPPQVATEPGLMPNSSDPLQAPPPRDEDAATHSSLQHQPVYSFESSRQSEPAFGLADMSSASASPNLVQDSSEELVILSDMEVNSSQPEDPTEQDKVHATETWLHPLLLRHLSHLFLKRKKIKNSLICRSFSSEIQLTSHLKFL